MTVYQTLLSMIGFIGGVFFGGVGMALGGWRLCAAAGVSWAAFITALALAS
jgi:hypothetical protein